MSKSFHTVLAEIRIYGGNTPARDAASDDFEKACKAANAALVAAETEYAPAKAKFEAATAAHTRAVGAAIAAWKAANEAENEAYLRGNKSPAPTV